VTARQREVLDLIAEGRTTKEISHALGISDRGVAAQVSRLLVKFAVTNRASLVAAVLSEPMSDAEPARPLRRWTDLSAAATMLGTDFGALRGAPFIVVVTLGRNHVIAFMNEQAENLTGVSIAAVFGTPLGDQLNGSAVPAWAAVIRDSFRTGAAASIERLLLRWKRDEGSWDAKAVDCVAQPLRGNDGTVRGTLFICREAAA
jgi:DNA-binding CsgD family transcriptional regulator